MPNVLQIVASLGRNESFFMAKFDGEMIAVVRREWYTGAMRMPNIFQSLSFICVLNEGSMRTISYLSQKCEENEEMT